MNIKNKKNLNFIDGNFFSFLKQLLRKLTIRFAWLLQGLQFIMISLSYSKTNKIGMKFCSKKFIGLNYDIRSIHRSSV
jgi:hypothetical protein